jgi:thymidylate synthase ThyX
MRRGSTSSRYLQQEESKIVPPHNEDESTYLQKYNPMTFHNLLNSVNRQVEQVADKINKFWNESAEDLQASHLRVVSSDSVRPSTAQNVSNRH